MPHSIPVWVPVLFVALMYLGYRQSKPRIVKPLTQTTVALAMLGLSLYGVASTFTMDAVALSCWAVGYASTLYLGSKHISSSGLSVEGLSVRIQGSWVPLMLILGIFVAKFILGFAEGVHSSILQHPGFITLMSTFLGALSGGFGARALAVQRCATETHSHAESVAN